MGWHQFPEARERVSFVVWYGVAATSRVVEALAVPEAEVVHAIVSIAVATIVRTTSSAAFSMANEVMLFALKQLAA